MKDSKQRVGRLLRWGRGEGLWVREGRGDEGNETGIGKFAEIVEGIA